MPASVVKSPHSAILHLSPPLDLGLDRIRAPPGVGPSVGRCPNRGEAAINLDWTPGATAAFSSSAARVERTNAFSFVSVLFNYF